MKTTILIAILSVSMIASTAGAFALYKSQDNANFTLLQNVFTDQQNVQVSKFVDSGIVCYLVTSKPASGSPQNSTAVSLSCLK